MSSSERFGFEWAIYSEIRPQYRDQYRQQFLNWLAPATPEFFRGKTILDAGCGMGRNSYWPLSWNAAEVIAFDKDPRSVAAARQALRDFPNASIEQHDIYHLPWRDKFDFVFSIGVIHHLKDPAQAIAQLYQALQPGGELRIWVYSHVGFEGLLKFLDPLRRHVTSKLPLPVLHLATYLFSLPLYLYLKIIPQSHPYFRQLRTFSFSHLHSILFDQLLPDIARYYTKKQARDLLANFDSVSIITPPNQNGWIVSGFKPSDSALPSGHTTAAT